MNPHIETLKQWLESRCEYHKDITELGWNTATTDAEIAALRAAIADMERMEWLDQECEVMVSTNCSGSPLIEHNRFLNPDDKTHLRAKIDDVAGFDHASAMKGGE